MSRLEKMVILQETSRGGFVSYVRYMKSEVRFVYKTVGFCGFLCCFGGAEIRFFLC